MQEFLDESCLLREVEKQELVAKEFQILLGKFLSVNEPIPVIKFMAFLPFLANFAAIFSTNFLSCSQKWQQNFLKNAKKIH